MAAITLTSCSRYQVRDFYAARGQTIECCADGTLAHRIATQINLLIYLKAVSGGNCAPGRPADCANLIRSEFNRRGLDGNAAVRVAQCESTLNPHATNGSHDGLFQQARAYWPDRARTYGVPGQSAFNPRANIVVSAGMVAGSGWSHWSCRP